jgi:hypothetical protein
MKGKVTRVKTGTKSILFGVHQFIWHPITVFMAWVFIFKRFPSPKEIFCIIIHDWGYWGREQMDDEDGETHPELGANIALRTMGRRYHDLVLLHSRHYARKLNRDPSILCWADKLSIIFEPWWMYLPRAIASGELKEYRALAATAGLVDKNATHREWHTWIRSKLSKLAKEKKATATPHMNPERG